MPFPSPGDLPDPGIEPAVTASAALAGGFCTTEPSGKPWSHLTQAVLQLKLFVDSFYNLLNSYSWVVEGCEGKIT